jgi:hypothetical protein
VKDGARVHDEETQKIIIYGTVTVIPSPYLYRNYTAVHHIRYGVQPYYCMSWESEGKQLSKQMQRLWRNELQREKFKKVAQDVSRRVGSIIAFI